MTVEASDAYHLLLQQRAEQQRRREEGVRLETHPTVLVYKSLFPYFERAIRAGNAQLTFEREAFEVNLTLGVTSRTGDWRILVFKDYKHIVDELYSKLGQYRGNRVNLHEYFESNGIVFVEPAIDEAGIFADVIRQMLAYSGLHDNIHARKEFLDSLGITVSSLHSTYWNGSIGHEDLYDFLAGGELPERPRRNNRKQSKGGTPRVPKQNGGDGHLVKIGRQGSGIYRVEYR